MSWWVKTVRSGKRFADGSLPAEVWSENATIPTLNIMDNTGESRATVIIFQAHQSGEVRVQGDTTQTLSAFMGTGGNNTPMVAYSVREDAKANNFSATELKVSNALNAMQLSPQSHHAQTFIASPPTVRRLTPVECERLQGFPDNWTAKRVDDKKGLTDQADSSRYKQMGNAVAVPVVEWIMARLVEADNDHS